MDVWVDNNRAVIGNPGDGRSGICIVAHVIKAACKYVEVLLAFAGYQPYSLDSNGSFTSARIYPARCRLLVYAMVGQVMLGVQFTKHPPKPDPRSSPF